MEDLDRLSKLFRVRLSRHADFVEFFEFVQFLILTMETAAKSHHYEYGSTDLWVGLGNVGSLFERPYGRERIGFEWAGNRRPFVDQLHPVPEPRAGRNLQVLLQLLGRSLARIRAEFVEFIFGMRGGKFRKRRIFGSGLLFRMEPLIGTM